MNFRMQQEITSEAPIFSEWPKINERSEYIFRACLIFLFTMKNKTKSFFFPPKEKRRNKIYQSP